MNHILSEDLAEDMIHGCSIKKLYFFVINRMKEMKLIKRKWDLYAIRLLFIFDLITVHYNDLIIITIFIQVELINTEELISKNINTSIKMIE